MSYAQYGLTETKASGSNHDKGIVKAPDGKYYKIDGFKHGQEDGLDQDKGSKVFDGALEAAGRKAGFDPSNFNTAGDVENALNAIGVTEKEDKGPKEPLPPIAHSPTVAHAKARVAQYEQDVFDGSYSSKLYDMDYKPTEANSFLHRYKLNFLGEKNKEGLYIDPKDQQRYDAEYEEYENKLNNPDLNDAPGATASNTGKYR